MAYPPNEGFQPGQPVPGRVRNTDRLLPPYSYVPGFHPHPVSHPAGHMHDEEHESPSPLDPDDWRQSHTYLYAIDLFNHGYYWEAHEAWESLWHAAGRRGPVADWLKGLIKLAAAAVKLREGNATGVRRHSERASELLNSACPAADKFAGLECSPILNRLSELKATEAVLAADPNKLLPLVLLLQ